MCSSIILHWSTTCLSNCSCLNSCEYIYSMFPIFTLLMDSSKVEYLIFFPVGLQWCLLVLQWESMLTCSKMNHIGRCSGDDPPCVGIVLPIEVHLWHSPHVVRHRNHPISSMWNMASYRAHYITGYFPLSQSYRDYCSSAWFFVLRGDKPFPRLDSTWGQCPDRLRCIDVPACHSLIHQEGISNVQSDKAFTPEPLHESSR